MESYQQIFYGAPGTGKSYAVKVKTAQAEYDGRVIRTTFHPDSDYSTFVGAYKPAMSGKNIIYTFRPQAFTNAYVKAWMTTAPVYLIIEEINRGNCAQIFGDLFQLLDRNDDGFSEYPIEADIDLETYLKWQLYNCQRKDMGWGVKEGRKLMLPNNLYIWATMNTSDQSLFPIDSAFKRRWDWYYVPISKGNEDWEIEVNGIYYDWWDFLQKINKRIALTTNSEDKKLGYYFCKAKDGVIDAKTFVGKVIFYLWNDVFKDFVDDANNPFKLTNDTLLSFDTFYQVEDGETKVVEESVKSFLDHLEVGVSVGDVSGNGNSSSSSKGPRPRYSINGSGKYSTPNAAEQIVRDYVKDNPNISVADMINTWNTIAGNKNFLVDSWQPSPNDNQPFADKRRTEIKWNNGSVWMSRGWTEATFQPFITNVKEKLGIDIVKVN